MRILTAADCNGQGGATIFHCLLSEDVDHVLSLSLSIYLSLSISLSLFLQSLSLLQEILYTTVTEFLLMCPRGQGA